MEMIERLAYYGVSVVIPIYIAQADEIGVRVASKRCSAKAWHICRTAGSCPIKEMHLEMLVNLRIRKYFLFPAVRSWISIRYNLRMSSSKRNTVFLEHPRHRARSVRECASVL
jgi:hypothetical protein